MKRLVSFLCLTLFCLSALAQKQEKENYYIVPDSIKAMGFITDVKIINKKDPKRLAAYISVNSKLFGGLAKNKTTKEMTWYFREYQQLKETWQSSPYNWEYNKTYKLLVLIASDSAANTSIYSGYIYLPNENKWKLVESKVVKQVSTINVVFLSKINKRKYAVAFSNRWLLRNNNTWKALDSQTTKPPILRPMSNIDSAAQQKIEEDNLNAKLPKDSVTYKEGIFYQSLKEGTGRLVKITDTVVIYYKGWLFSDGSIFDETKEKPATFPLQRLIRGWQIGMPQCKVGGTIRLFIPSGSAYGIRTFATDIPPNSTLVFDVEVVEVKEKMEK